jgi:hypothetical protein
MGGGCVAEPGADCVGAGTGAGPWPEHERCSRPKGTCRCHRGRHGHFQGKRLDKLLAAPRLSGSGARCPVQLRRGRLSSLVWRTTHTPSTGGFKRRERSSRTLEPENHLDYPTGPAYHLMGFDTPTFTPVCVARRITGWTAHIMEQLPHTSPWRMRGQRRTSCSAVSDPAGV